MLFAIAPHGTYGLPSGSVAKGSHSSCGSLRTSPRSCSRSRE